MADDKLRAKVRALLAEVNERDPGLRNTPSFSLNERQGRRERLIAQHYVAYGARHVLYELFPDLPSPASSEGGEER